MWWLWQGIQTSEAPECCYSCILDVIKDERLREPAIEQPKCRVLFGCSSASRDGLEL